MSCSIWPTSICIPGSCAVIFARTSAIIWSVLRLRSLFKSTEILPAAAGGGRDFGHRVDKGHDVADYAIRIRQRVAGRHDVVHHETSFVHGWQQVCSQRTVAPPGEPDQDPRKDRQNPSVIQYLREQVLVSRENSGHQSVVFLVVSGIPVFFSLGSKKIQSQIGRPCNGKNQRGEKSRRYCDRLKSYVLGHRGVVCIISLTNLRYGVFLRSK